MLRSLGQLDRSPPKARWGERGNWFSGNDEGLDTSRTRAYIFNYLENVVSQRIAIVKPVLTQRGSIPFL